MAVLLMTGRPAGGGRACRLGLWPVRARRRLKSAAVKRVVAAGAGLANTSTGGLYEIVEELAAQPARQ